MRRLLALAAIAVALLLPSALASGGSSLEGRVASVTGVSRVVDASLVARAQARAREMAAVRLLWHCCLASGEGEIIGYNAWYPDPEAQVVKDWMLSPSHHDLMVDPDYTRIGCGAAQAGERWYFDCLFAVPVKRVVPVVPASSGLPALLPDTATR